MTDEIRKLAAIMFTDMVGYSALTQKHEALALELLEEHRRLLRPIFPKYNGTEIKTIGDAFFVEFPSALDAVNCAVEMQKTLHEYNSSSPETVQIKIRIGIHLGDVVHRESDVYGDGVNIASRIEPVAEPGGICISQQVFDQVHNKLKEPIQKLGMGDLKNIQLPVALYKIVLPWEKATLPMTQRLRFLLKKRKARMLVTLSLIVVAALFLVLINNRKSELTEDEKTIAVLPFTHTGDDILAEGLEEDVKRELEKVPDLIVISTKGSSMLKSSDLPDSSIATELGARFLLKCNVELVSDHVKLALSLNDYKYKKEIWRESYEKQRTQIIEIRNDLIGKILDNLQIGKENFRKMSKTSSQEAFDFYLQGLYHFNKDTKEEFTISVDNFSESNIKDSTFASSIEALSKAQFIIYESGYDTSKAIVQKAETNCRKALIIDSLSAQALAILGAVEIEKGDTSQGINLLKKVLEINQNNRFALNVLSRQYLFFDNRLQEAIPLLIKLQRLTPFSPDRATNLGIAYALSNNAPLAIKNFRRAIELGPNSGLAWNNLGYMSERLGDYELAEQCYRSALGMDPIVDSYESLAKMQIKLSKLGEADSILKNGIEKIQNTHRLVSLRGVISSLKGKSEDAKRFFNDGLLLVKKSIQKDPKNYENHADAGLFYARLGQEKQASDAALKAVKLDSSDDAIIIKVAATFAVLEQKEEMMKWFKRVRNRNPEYDEKYLATAVDFEKFRNDPDLLFIARMK